MKFFRMQITPGSNVNPYEKIYNTSKGNYVVNMMR